MKKNKTKWKLLVRFLDDILKDVEIILRENYLESPCLSHVNF